MPRIVGRCVRGLEWVSAEEADARKVASGIVLGQREVAFDVPGLNDDLLGLRTVDDVMLALDGFGGVDHTKAALDELAQGLAQMRFRRAVEQLRLVRALPARPTLDVVAALTGKRNYNRYAVEDVAGEIIGPQIGARYVSRNPLRDAGAQGAPAPGPCDLTVRLFLSGQDVQVALRLPARPPHRREWKQLTGPGTLHPPLAAALVRIAGVQKGETVADPFCGDGTIAIEAALSAGPGAGGRILAADLDPERLVNAGLNAEAAGVASALSLVRADAGRAAWRPGSLDAIITNPPWNRSVGAQGSVQEGMDAFWDALRDGLSERGRVCLVADAELDVREQARRHGFDIALAQTVRLAGRLSVVLLASPPGARRAWLPQGLAQWRANAVADGVVSAQGF
ncbi:MAG TPA: methyltransferase [Actinocrinis sp.]